MDIFPQPFLEHFYPKFEYEMEENEDLEKHETSSTYAPLI
jgi:hypothetical protein